MNRANQYFVMRHGQSQANAEHLIISYPGTGCARYGLTQVGQRQARVSALESGLGSQVEILASDFLRTRQTAEVVAQVLACRPPRWDQRLRERFFGQFEATSADNYDQVWLHDAEQPNQSMMGVESVAEVVSRLSGVIQHLDRFERGRTYLLVSHGDPLRFLQAWAHHLDLSQHQRILPLEQAEIRPLLEPRWCQAE